MRKTLIMFTALVAAGGFASVANAQEGTINGAAGGAVTGAIVGGPVGAAVGGVAGAIVGTAIDPPPQKVVTYVQEQPMPAEPVIIKEKVVVGQPLPQTVQVVTIPEEPKYAYAVVNEQRVIVDPQTRTVVQVVQ